MAEIRTFDLDEAQLIFWCSICFGRMASICVACRGPNASVISIGSAGNQRCPSCARCRLSPTARCYSSNCKKFGFEGVVSKRLASRYSRAEPQMGQDEVPGWRRVNAERWRRSRVRASPS